MKLRDKLAQEKLYLEDEIRLDMNFAQIIGASPALRKVLRHAETVAPTDSTVLIYGETGTGKELIARAIHDLGPRRSKPFVKLNCAAIPTEPISAAIVVLIFAARQNRSVRLTALSSGRKRSRSAGVSEIIFMPLRFG